MLGPLLSKLNRHGLFIAPKDSPLIVELTKLVWPLAMRYKHGNFTMKVVGDGLTRLKKLRKKRVVICPNHASEDDAEVIFGLTRLAKESFYFLTAHEIFHGNKGWNGLLLPHLGCYSITRGIQDIAAYRMTRRLLVENKRKLIAFPEGEVSHFNEIFMPLERGIVQMAFSAMDEMDRRKIKDTIYVLPIGIKYLFSENVLEQLEHSMVQIEACLGSIDQTGELPVPPSLSNGPAEGCELTKYVSDPRTTSLSEGNARDALADRVRKALFRFVSKMEARHGLIESPGLPFAQRMHRLRSAMLTDVARRLSIDLPTNSTQVECAHTLKSTLCDIFFHESARRRHEFDVPTLKELYRDLLCAIHLIAVENSLVESSKSEISQEELAEMIELLEAALHLKRSIRGSKVILIEIGEPIDLRKFQPEYKNDKNAVVKEINHIIRLELLSMIASLSLKRDRQSAKPEACKITVATKRQGVVVNKPRPDWVDSNKPS